MNVSSKHVDVTSTEMLLRSMSEALGRRETASTGPNPNSSPGSYHLRLPPPL